MENLNFLRSCFKEKKRFTHLYTGGPVKISTDENYFFCCVEETVNVVSLLHANVVSVVPGDGELITSFAVFPTVNSSSITLVSCSRSLTMRLWKINIQAVDEDDFIDIDIAGMDEKNNSKKNVSSKNDPVMLKSWKAHEAPVIASVVDESCTLLATGSSDKTVKVYDIDKGYFTHNFRGHQGIVTAVAFLPNNRNNSNNNNNNLRLVSCCEDSIVRIWDLLSRSCIFELKGHMAVVTSLAFTDDGETLLTGGRDKVVNVWNVSDGKLKNTIGAYESVESLSLLPTGSNINKNNNSGDDAEDDGDDKNSKKKRKLSVSKSAASSKSASTTSTATRFVTAGSNGLLRIWNLEASKCEVTEVDRISKPQINYILPLFKHNEILSVNVTHNFSFHNTKDLKRERLVVGHSDEIIDTKYISDESLAVATNNDAIYIFKINDWSCSILEGHTDIVLALDVSVNKKFLVSGAKDNTVRIWDVETKSNISFGDSHTGSVTCVAFSKKKTAAINEQFAVSASEDNTIKIWPLSSKSSAATTASAKSMSARMTIAAHDKGINAVCVSPNDQFIASASQDKTVKIWKSENLSSVFVLKGHKRGVWTVEFSPVDKVVASGSADQTIRIWSLTDGSCLKTFEGHNNSVLKVLFLSRGMQIASSGSDGLLKIWTIKTGDCAQTIDAHEDKIWGLATNSTESQLVTGGGDSSIILWNDCTKAEEESALLEKQSQILANQELMNLLQKKNYTDAVKIALDLEQPGRLFHIFEMILEEETVKHCDTILKEEIKKIPIEKIRLCLNYIRDWNTSSKQSLIAQSVLNVILTTIPIKSLKEIQDLPQILEGLIPYSERHLARVNKLIQNSYFVDFTLDSIKT